MRGKSLVREPVYLKSNNFINYTVLSNVCTCIENLPILKEKIIQKSKYVEKYRGFMTMKVHTYINVKTVTNTSIIFF